MRLPDTIAARCLAGDEPFGGSWLSLALESGEDGSKAVFSFAFGPAREDGRLSVQRDELLAQSHYLEEVVGLDYGGVEERWNGRGWLSVAGAAELRHQFRLTFTQPPPRQATVLRLAAARALRHLEEFEGEESYSISIETRLGKGIALETAAPPPGEWLPDDLREPVRELLDRLARRQLRDLVESGSLRAETANRIETEILDYGATPIPPPDIALLLATAKDDGEGGWTIEVPLWTREEGPCDLSAWIRAREREYGLELELRGVTLA